MSGGLGIKIGMLLGSGGVSCSEAPPTAESAVDAHRLAGVLPVRRENKTCFKEVTSSTKDCIFPEAEGL